MNLKRLLTLLSKPRGNPQIAEVAIRQFLKDIPTTCIAGNFMAVVGEGATTIFIAHYDTVDPMDCYQDKHLAWKNKEKTLLGLSKDDKSGARCLGADDGAGCEILACLYEAGVPGIYLWTAEEETGCLGTKRLLKQLPAITEGINRVVSFDRKGTTDIITEQSFVITASDTFAQALAVALCMNHAPSPWGSYTDSKEYASHVPECTNISVGYKAAHTRHETLDIEYMRQLIVRLVTIQWEDLPTVRDPKAFHIDWNAEDICFDDPYLVYMFLSDMGLTEELEAYARGEKIYKEKETEGGSIPLLCNNPFLS